MSHKIVVEHDMFRTLHEVIHYPTHEQREESEEFREVKKSLHAEGVKCFIDNGRCEGALEVHHNIIEWATSNEIDWEKVEKEMGFHSVDSRKQMLVLCAKHHRGKGTGIHECSFPAWILQKFLTPQGLEAFEKAVEQLKHKKAIQHP